MGKKNYIQNKEHENDKSFNNSILILQNSAIFSPLITKTRIINKKYGFGGYAKVYRNGYILCSTTLYADPKQWAHVIAHCLLHLGMGHFDFKRFNLSYLDPMDTKADQHSLLAWNYACDLVVERFLADIKLGTPPPDPQDRKHIPFLPDRINNEIRVYERLLQENPADYSGFGTMSKTVADMVFADYAEHKGKSRNSNSINWTEIFAHGLAEAVRNAVNAAGGLIPLSAGKNETVSTANREKRWFISKYPLLGSIAANFEIIESPIICSRMQIHTAAVSPQLREIYINPAANLSETEYRFVIAHELLHAGLRHDIRCEWRDAYYWNLACDFVINQWLIEMDVGVPPNGILFDEQFKGLSAEAVYDRIVTDIRRFRKLATLRGAELGDILSKSDYKDGEGIYGREYIDLDEFYRRSLGQGLLYHENQNRGYLPAGLIEEIRALYHPPIPWDVELARWFDNHFIPLEKVRSYARPSRRQSSSPDIPRPSWVTAKPSGSHTFGVLLDTSGSMNRRILANALGAISSYALARDVSVIRVLFCDAAVYDQGYLRPEDIAGTVKIKGRGGTILQPGIDILKNDKDFPDEAPLLIITDGYCENKLILYGRVHAYLIPEGNRLPFIPKGEVFRLK